MNIETIGYICIRLRIVPSTISDFNAGVVELVDTLDLGSSAAMCGGSSPLARTDKNRNTDGNQGVAVFLLCSLYDSCTISTASVIWIRKIIKENEKEVPLLGSIEQVLFTKETLRIFS